MSFPHHLHLAHLYQVVAYASSNRGLAHPPLQHRYRLPDVVFSRCDETCTPSINVGTRIDCDVASEQVLAASSLMNGRHLASAGGQTLLVDVRQSDAGGGGGEGEILDDEMIDDAPAGSCRQLLVETWCAEALPLFVDVSGKLGDLVVPALLTGRCLSIAHYILDMDPPASRSCTGSARATKP